MIIMHSSNRGMRAYYVSSLSSAISIFINVILMDFECTMRQMCLCAFVCVCVRVCVYGRMREVDVCAVLRCSAIQMLHCAYYVLILRTSASLSLCLPHANKHSHPHMCARKCKFSYMKCLLNTC